MTLGKEIIVCLLGGRKIQCPRLMKILKQLSDSEQIGHERMTCLIACSSIIIDENNGINQSPFVDKLFKRLAVTQFLSIELHNVCKTQQLILVLVFLFVPSEPCFFLQLGRKLTDKLRRHVLGTLRKYLTSGDRPNGTVLGCRVSRRTHLKGPDQYYVFVMNTLIFLCLTVHEIIER
ncbi:hypothetical protein AGLY_005767 [Aphis glycines]|uniref:Uncharacterized protein n=1 Tax=Aphis glycines TaxID=307491 RepID=A0A6G0TU59_APHGL|nr:hypothetical protein AGLY_005767 [Aphis glycines]